MSLLYNIPHIPQTIILKNQIKQNKPNTQIYIKDKAQSHTQTTTFVQETTPKVRTSNLYITWYI